MKHASGILFCAALVLVVGQADAQSAADLVVLRGLAPAAIRASALAAGDARFIARHGARRAESAAGTVSGEGR